MKYEVKLLEADIQGPMLGQMQLALHAEGKEQAQLAYDWTDSHFTARFLGHAPSMPAPAHPVAFLSRPIEAIQALKTDQHIYPTDVFKDHQVSFELTE